MSINEGRLEMMLCTMPLDEECAEPLDVRRLRVEEVDDLESDRRRVVRS